MDIIDTIINYAKNLEGGSILLADVELPFHIVDFISGISRNLVIFNENAFYRGSMHVKLRRRPVITTDSKMNVIGRSYELAVMNSVGSKMDIIENSQIETIISLISTSQEIPGFAKVDGHVFRRVHEASQIIIDADQNEKSEKKDIFCSFFTVNYNTSKLINILIQSIHKYVKSFNYDIRVFDNSDKEKLELSEEWPDVHVIDNTKGQMVDYSKKLPEYCEMKEYDTFKGFISLKHALAVQAGIDDERISDNIILCDSDIVIFKDLNFLDPRYISCGMPEQKPGDHERLAPYLCYLNRAKMNELHIRYFDPSRFHGAQFRRQSDNKIVTNFLYDTGTSFFEDVKRLDRGEFLSIDIYKYCIHFGSQSRTDDRARKGNYDIPAICEKLGLNYETTVRHIDYSTDIQERYKQIKDLFGVKKTKKKYVVYTCITGGYDDVIAQEHRDDSFDYVCFTDMDMKSDFWKVVDIKAAYGILKIDSPAMLARFFKTHPHLLFEKYEQSIWLDGTMIIKTDRIKKDFLPLLGNDYILMKQHPKITNVYNELMKCMAMKKESKERLMKIKTFLDIIKFNNEGDHVETGVMLRRHNDEKCMFLMERWWEMIRDFSIRDQLSFNYVFSRWEGKFSMLPCSVMHNKFFDSVYIHKNNKKV